MKWVCFYSFPDPLHAGFHLSLNFQNIKRSVLNPRMSLTQKEPMELWNQRKRRKSRSFAGIIQMLWHTSLITFATNEEFFLINFRKQVPGDFRLTLEITTTCFFSLQTLIFWLEAFETTKNSSGKVNILK